MNVYDFDNTIYRGESTLDFFFFYITKHPHILKYMPKVIDGFAKYELGKVSIDEFMDKYAPLIQKEFNPSVNWDSLAKEFWDKHMKNIKPFYSRVRRDDDLIITASPEVTMNEICRRMGIKHCHCSEIDSSGRVTHMNMRENKVVKFKKLYGDRHIEDFYTDSIENDKFLADSADRIFIVDGDKITQIK